MNLTKDEKINISCTLLQDYKRISEALMSYIGDKEKSLNQAREVLYSTIEQLLKELGTITPKTLKQKLQEEFENSPMVLFIRSKEGFYRKYDKISYYARNIVYASYGFGIDTKCFTYKELQKAIMDKEVELK